MKIQTIILMLFIAVTDNFSQEIKSEPSFTNVRHNQSKITLSNSNGTRSTIYLNGNSATLNNSDGTQSTIDFFSNSSNLIAIDGTQSSIIHNRSSSTVTNSDGTQLIVIHKHTSSSCSTPIGSHTINHFFGNIKERRYKDKIDVLIHANWFAQQKQLLRSNTAQVTTQE